MEQNYLIILARVSDRVRSVNSIEKLKPRRDFTVVIGLDVIIYYAKLYPKGRKFFAARKDGMNPIIVAIIQGKSFLGEFRLILTLREVVFRWRGGILIFFSNDSQGILRIYGCQKIMLLENSRN